MRKRLKKNKIMDIFSRYAPFIQEYIYDNDWDSLRAVQVAAGDAIFNTDENVLLTASTASGKTEAAFFPILTLLSESPSSSVGVLYIAPLKALINDQFRRLDEVCRDGNIPVWRRHGDVSQSHKEKLFKNPSGVLQITPESLEALLIHKHSYISALFGDLRFIVIDEVHSLLRGDRGAQTLCLIERLCRMANINPRRIGLSATVGEPEKTGEYLSAGSGRGCIIPEIKAPGTKWRLSMEHFYVADSQAETKEKTEFIPALDEKTDIAPKGADPGIGYIFEHTLGVKSLVFVNSREECEGVTTSLRQYCEARGEPDRFLIHHGNLSASFRESAEELMKDEESLLTTVTTATLELGIDIGRLQRAFQIDAPFTVSSFLQRMGRTGRRGDPQEMWFVIREDMPEPRTLLPGTVPWKLLQGISLIQLYLEEKFVEPPRLDRLPYSLIYHQTMSTLVSCGELSAAELAGRVLCLTPFYRISTDDYKILLRHLIDTDQIQRTERGGLIAGIGGERVVNSYKFYAVFQESEEFTVRCGSEELGTVVLPPPAGEKIAIAGRTWLVDEVDRKRRLVYCSPVKGKVPAYFGECPGDLNTRVLLRMRQTLAEDKNYPYLMEHAAARLQNARGSAVAAGITEKNLIFLGGNMWALFPWLGTYGFMALERLIKLRMPKSVGINSVDSFKPYYIQFKLKTDGGTFLRELKRAAEELKDPMELLFDGEEPEFEKYDKYVPGELVRKGFAYGVLDIEEMKKCVEGLCL